MSEKFRLNCNIPTSLNEDLNRLADEIGLPKTSLVVIALKTYVDQQDIIAFNKMTAKLEYEKNKNE